MVGMFERVISPFVRMFHTSTFLLFGLVPFGNIEIELTSNETK